MAEGRQGDAYREVRLEGLGLVVLSAIVLVALSGAFFLGRWWESRFHPAAGLGGGGADPLANVVAAGGGEPSDVGESATYFDTVEGQDKQAEPAREMPSAAGSARTPLPAQPTAPRAQPAEEGDYFVQVAAIHDEAAAAGLVERLQSESYRVRLFTQQDGRNLLYKVRVGGYASQEAARATAQELQQKGYQGAWVTKAN